MTEDKLFNILRWISKTKRDQDFKEAIQSKNNKYGYNFLYWFKDIKSRFPGFKITISSIENSVNFDYQDLSREKIDELIWWVTKEFEAEYDKEQKDKIIDKWEELQLIKEHINRKEKELKILEKDFDSVLPIKVNSILMIEEKEYFVTSIERYNDIYGRIFRLARNGSQKEAIFLSILEVEEILKQDLNLKLQGCGLARREEDR